MSYEMLVGLHVLDDQEYQKYRAAMKPILSSYGGAFGYDFRVSEVLLSQTEEEINRVFTINFSDAEQMDGFFTNPEYLIVKEKYFKDSVASVTIISSYQK
ncbi:DUF1330 domain-containing protein [Motiliproteus sp. MSK22-1]|uniref:DUF1330 domain-containing protein n=1 Tax=Motiliproteus sp. MSK22-1 TaxID=1897630 RepID=UPI0009758FD4|nr:DUF1330 domain-containing protein [Motiliproteus sp. MSK22-1]OMH37973.1 DUF1330 domain-containing protein [Motiliproteus sp. MSK22-1]